MDLAILKSLLSTGISPLNDQPVIAPPVLLSLDLMVNGVASMMDMILSFHPLRISF